MTVMLVTIALLLVAANIVAASRRERARVPVRSDERERLAVERRRR